ncbi:hypothetical protein K488DRAFT_57605 [Vararia minispora EC-137]|uniref:Uncharacterized protein n=1 Tax=Vararia minispora EC-137 TaxID=1314806 RepID=A0ACB8QAU9_9AGAM|nr:hypothetical protein K488DRAFT_57605 [Vararia minispora EC-137]
MSSFLKNLKDKVTKDKDAQKEYSIQPHPAKTNDPADLQPHGGLNSNHQADAFHARDPHVPAPHIANNLPEPASREELRARQAELNK